MSAAASWTDPDVIVQAGAGVAAIVAAIVVIVQTVLTRKALEEAARSRRTAQDALEVARSEHRNGTFLAIEAVRSRISLNAPSAELHVDKVIDALYSPSITGSGYPQAWQSDHVFHVRDKTQPLMVRAEVTLRNIGARSTRFTLHHAIRKASHVEVNSVSKFVGTDPGPDEVLLAPGQELKGFWEVTRSMQEWIDIYEERAKGSPGPEALLEAYVDDGQDTGASYIYRVALGGTALKPELENLRESWVSAGLYELGLSMDGLGAGTMPVLVRAWLSKTDEIPLPQVGPVIEEDVATPTS